MRPASRPESEAPVSGMSFLGLSDSSPSRSSGYLLEDEEEARPWGKIILFILLLGVGGGLAWQWHVGGYPWTLLPQRAAATNPGATPPAQTPDQTAAPTQAPAPTQNPAPLPTEPNPPAAVTTNPAAKTDTEAPPAAAEATQPPATAEKESTPAAPEPEKSAEETEKAPAAAPEKPAKAAVTHPKPAPPEPAVSAGEALFAQGQKYLYGKGVEENCALALRSFQAAADRDHVQAESTLGVMYFTGHCVNRDLPTAYRWFAKALREDPTNTRLEQNLRSVWSAMTPGERQSATRSE